MLANFATIFGGLSALVGLWFVWIVAKANKDNAKFATDIREAAFKVKSAKTDEERQAAQDALNSLINS